ncbi:hypothetical protein B0H14DRAFT_2598222 [Mycena olivaceomarginata]|nr:hypothetical protein B0H14DRAFT_2598222 [Mycena olivaceomarginata]
MYFTHSLLAALAAASALATTRFDNAPPTFVTAMLAAPAVATLPVQCNLMDCRAQCGVGCGGLSACAIVDSTYRLPRPHAHDGDPKIIHLLNIRGCITLTTLFIESCVYSDYLCSTERSWNIVVSIGGVVRT